MDGRNIVVRQPVCCRKANKSLPIVTRDTALRTDKEVAIPILVDLTHIAVHQPIFVREGGELTACHRNDRGRLPCQSTVCHHCPDGYWIRTR